MSILKRMSLVSGSLVVLALLSSSPALAVPRVGIIGGLCNGTYSEIKLKNNGGYFSFATIYVSALSSTGQTWKGYIAPTGWGEWSMTQYGTRTITLPNMGMKANWITVWNSVDSQWTGWSYSSCASSAPYSIP